MKRLIICADGTWEKPDQIDPQRKQKYRGVWTRNPTNVVKIARAIRPTDSHDIPQIVYYDEGVGTGTGDRWSGGMFGLGLSENILQCYRFLVENHEDGDEVYLFGFSRGAFTVRSLAGFIGRIGLLTKDDEYYTPEAYDHYRLKLYDKEDIENLLKTRYLPWYLSIIGESGRARLRARLQKESDENREKVRVFREGPFRHRNHPVRDIKIKMVGVWDTVGALGVPFVSPLGYWLNRKYLFHNVKLGARVENAYHAVAIDERRKPFRATLWQGPTAPGQTMEQVWFAGSHANVGGGYYPSGLENAAFHWMVERAGQVGLEFDKKYLKFFFADPTSELRDSYKSFWKLFGKYERRIGEQPDGNEKVHISVKQRKEADPPPKAEFGGKYEPGNLSEETLHNLLTK